MDLELQQRLARLQRPEGSQPPDDRNFGDSYRLPIESLEDLRPGEWLDDSDINCFMRLLCLARPGECFAFDSNALNVLLQSGDPTASTEAAVDSLYEPYRIQAAIVTGNRGLVFMPFCIRHHWILVVADFQHQVIRVYDSMVTRDEQGMIARSSRVNDVLPHVWPILSFCIEEAQWQIDVFWLPIAPTANDCGVYICLMALHHSYRRMFTPADYVTGDGHSNFYYLDDCYWLVGRMTILKVCRRYLRSGSADTQEKLLAVEQAINNALRAHLCLSPAQGYIRQLMPCFTARSWTLSRVIDALSWAIDRTESLDSTQRLLLSSSIEESELVQREARSVILTPLGEPSRDRIVDEAVKYAWHDAEALHNWGEDLKLARASLIREKSLGYARMRTWVAWEHCVDQNDRVARMQEQIHQAQLRAQELWADCMAQKTFVVHMEEDMGIEQTPSVTPNNSPSSPEENESEGLQKI